MQKECLLAWKWTTKKKKNRYSLIINIKKRVMMSLNKKILILTAGLLLCSQAKAQMEAGLQALPFDKEVVKGTLSNGMTYYIQHNENPKRRAKGRFCSGR